MKQGDVVYLITCFDCRSGNRQIETVHATFDGTRAKLEKIAGEWMSAGYKAKFNGDVEVRDLNENLIKIYKVQTRKIVE